MSEARQGAVFLALGLIAMTADSPNTIVWFLLSIIVMVVVLLVPMPRMRKAYGQVPRKLRGVHSVPVPVPGEAVRRLGDPADKKCNH